MFLLVPYITAYGFSALNVLAGVLGSWETGRVHCVEAVIHHFILRMHSHMNIRFHPSSFKKFPYLISQIFFLSFQIASL